MCNFYDGNTTCPSPSVGAASQTFTSALQFFAAAQCLVTEDWPPDADVIDHEEFNYIIVGAGTAGSIVANRLSEVKDKSISLVEAGGNPPAESIIPSMSYQIVGSKYDWHFVTTTDKRTNKAYKNGKFYLPRGKFLGGSSSINGMAYFKGCLGDYEKWKSAGNEDWSSEIARKYFKKAESLQDQDLLNIPTVKDSYGLNGHIAINRFNNSYRSVYDSILNSWDEIGIYKVDDLNAANLNGCGLMTANAADGVRWSTAKAYLIPARDRPNLKVLKNTLVTKILIDSNTMHAYGVEVLRNNKTFKLLAKDEVIICAGAMNTPQLLMLSGIGPKSHLESKNITVVVDSPMVEQNFQDHSVVPITIYGKSPDKHDDEGTKHFDALQYLFNRTGNLVQNAADIVAFYSYKKYSTCPEYQNHFDIVFQNDSNSVLSLLSNYNNLNDTVVDSVIELNKKYTLYLFSFFLSHPFSKGNITLASNNPRDDPVIYTNYMSDSRDIDSSVRGIKMISSRIINTTYFKSVGAFLGRISWPPCDKYELDSNDYWRCICKYLVLPGLHNMGSARMGPDIETSVVDSKLRVYGVAKLRVVDASVIPFVVSGNSLGPIVMVGERGADLIKESITSYIVK